MLRTRPFVLAARVCLQAIRAVVSLSYRWRKTMGAYCLLESIGAHPARIGEIMEVVWFDYHGPIVIGDKKEIACIPHAGCRLEIVATPLSAHRKVDLLLPGQIIRYSHSFFRGDRFELPGGSKVSLRYLVGFKFQLASGAARPPQEEAMIRKAPVERTGPCIAVSASVAPVGSRMTST